MLYDQVKGREKGKATQSISEYHKSLKLRSNSLFSRLAKRFDQKLICVRYG